jgi:hypothetical protein
MKNESAGDKVFFAGGGFFARAPGTNSLILLGTFRSSLATILRVSGIGMPPLKIMKKTLFVLPVAVGLLVLPLHAENPSPEIEKVLKDRLVEKHDLRLNDLTGARPTPEQTKRLEDKASYERYNVPYPQNMADGFSYSIYRFKATGEMWITKTGGFAGISELYILPKPK